MIERDWITRSGLRAVCYLIPNRHRCGYVELPPGHPLHGAEYGAAHPALSSVDLTTIELGKKSPMLLFTGGVDAAEGDVLRRSPDVVFDVHGGITYSGDGRGVYPAPSDGGWWLGFDCGHYGDGSLDPKSFCDGPVRSEEYVVAECESLARQIADMFPAEES